MALYPLPKQYSTDFSNPKKKPVGDVEIDWSNPLTKGLKAFYMPVMGSPLSMTGINGSDSPPYLYNLVNRLERATAFYGIQDRGYHTEMFGQEAALVQNGGAAHQIKLQTTYAFTDSEPYTAIAKTFAPNGETAINSWGGVNNGFWNRRGVYFRFYATVGIIALDAFTANTGGVTVALSSDGGGTGGGTVNVYQEETNESDSLTGQSLGMTFNNLGLGSNNDTTGNYIYSALWDRELSATEIHSFNKKPYQILKSKNPPEYFSPSVSSGITVTEQTNNTNYTSLDSTVTLTGSLSITETLVNTNYTALNPSIVFTGVLSITEQLKNTNYTSLDPIIDLTGLVDITENLVNTNYDTLNPTITLTSGVVAIVEQIVNTQYNAFNPGILLTPEPLGIVSTVCFDGVIEDLVFNGLENSLIFNGNIEDVAFGGNVKAIVFNGTIQTTCNTGSIKTNC